MKRWGYYEKMGIFAGLERPDWIQETDSIHILVITSYHFYR